MNVVDRIVEFNRDREEERVKIKFANMQKDAFSFLRATCHLFYEDLPQNSLPSSPIVWICGDLHLQNFGSYKGSNQQIYFDINDFDESIQTNALLEIVRMTTSILVGANSLKLSQEEAENLCNHFLKAYQKALIFGKALWVERETSEGMIKDLLISLKIRSISDFENKRIEKYNGAYRLRVDGKKALPTTEENQMQVKKFLEQEAGNLAIPFEFEVIDVARRIAGSGSLGIERYIILLKATNEADTHWLFDLKQSRPSSLAHCISQLQPQWKNEAERIITVQNMMQAVSPAFFNEVDFDNKTFILKELQPSEDRVELKDWKGKIKRLERVIGNMGEIVAWGQLRSSGRLGSATADELIAFGKEEDWVKKTLSISKEMALLIENQWQEFAKADFK